MLAICLFLYFYTDIIYAMLLDESDLDKISKAGNVNIKVVNIGAGGAVAVRMSAASSFVKKITPPPGAQAAPPLSPRY
jgi:hypothetical protein